MSKSILEAIFKGDLPTWEQKAVTTESLQKLRGKMQKERDYFMENMTQHQQQSFDDYHCLVSNSIYEEISNHEYNSYIIGILVGMEIIEQKQSILED